MSSYRAAKGFHLGEGQGGVSSTLGVMRLVFQSCYLRPRAPPHPCAGAHTTPLVSRAQSSIHKQPECLAVAKNTAVQATLRVATVMKHKEERMREMLTVSAQSTQRWESTRTYSLGLKKIVIKSFSPISESKAF